MGTRDDRNVYPVSTATFTRLLEESGYKLYQVDEDRGCVILDIRGEGTLLRLQVIEGKAPNRDVWYTRFLAYSLELEPGKAGIDRATLLEWLNAKNADLLFGRYYLDERTDTVAFEVSIPGNGGIHADDFVDALRIATVTVDKTHGELLALKPVD
ncbi:MAG: YbjN domain-containing protein [Deltaproteobacteria bacterium]|nr:YbjN domain-containing protein [Deltaproteobacteria bacterium]